MNFNTWEKVTDYKLLGIKLFSKRETCKDYDFSNMTYSIKVSPEYYKAEFEDKDNG